MSATNVLHSTVLSHLQTQTSASSQSVLHRNLTFFTPRRRNLRYHHTNKTLIPARLFYNDRRFIANSNSASTASPISDAADSVLDVGFIRRNCRKWLWRGRYSINYFDSSVLDLPSPPHSGPPLLLVHGFGASIPHWRRNIKTLAQNHTVYAIDLLGFGASAKPLRFPYTMETWVQLILDFLDEIIQKPTVLMGNSIGSLACVIAASVSGQTLVRGLVLLNCAGGMNKKAAVGDWRERLSLPVWWLIYWLAADLLKQKGTANVILEIFNQREFLRGLLLTVYGNKDSVDKELVEIFRRPADDVGAMDAFASIFTGPPGPNPVELMPRISLPVLVLWGDQDPYTPIDGPVGRYFSSLSSQQANVKFFVLEGVGHWPHDDRPDSVHEKLLPWLASLPIS